jgi:glucose-1-phosphate cytidylyltransferase
MENDGTVQEFQEKPVLDEWINGGFFVFEREIFDRLESNSILEKEPLAGLAREGLLMAYRHEGFWKCMDTYKDNLELNKLWDIGAPWKVW